MITFFYWVCLLIVAACALIPFQIGFDHIRNGWREKDRSEIIDGLGHLAGAILLGGLVVLGVMDGLTG